MRKILFLMMIALVSISGISAKKTVDFRLQADGTFLNESDGKTFAIIPFGDKSQKELYSRTLVAVTKLYNSPKDVISKVEGEIISVNGISQDCISLKTMLGGKAIFSIQYILQFQFKDGKIRVDAPVIARLYTDNTPDISPFSGWLGAQSVFKKGIENPKKQKTIDDFNNTLNTLINDVISNIEDNHYEDW